MALLSVLLACCTAAPLAEEPGWPTHRADRRRSGYTASVLAVPLVERWRYEGAAPRPGWGQPARGSYWQRLDSITARVTFDRVHAPVCDGQVVVQASSSDDQVRCFDLSSGALRWSTLLPAAARLAPVLDAGQVLVGGDDGVVRALALDDGSEVWATRLAPEERLVPARGRLASIWPVRTGLVLEGGELFATAGLFPGQGVVAACLDARDGSVRWRKELSGVSPQGYLLLSETRLYVPSGRATPIVLDRGDGSQLGTFGGPGGAWALLTEGEELVSGPGNTGELALAGGARQDRIASFAGRRMVVTPRLTYLQTDTGITAIDRAAYLEAVARHAGLAQRARAGEAVAEALASAEADLAASVPWTVTTPHLDSLIVAGDTVVAGGAGGLVLLDASTGDERWRLTLEGRVLALAVAGGRLMAATDRGSLHVFGPGTSGKLAGHRPVPRVPRAEIDPWLRAMEADPKGYAVLLGRTVEEAAALAAATELAVVLVPNDIDGARREVQEFGMGGRVQLLEAVDGRLPLTDACANLVVAPRRAAAEARRVLRPEGGVLLLDGEREVRGGLPGAGSWSHAYADAGNRACSDDTRVGGTLRLQWYGGPGPRTMVDRHLRTAPPVVTAGTLYLPAFDRVIACDAYNGTVLWERDLPGLSRTGFPFDGGYLAADRGGLWCGAGPRAVHLDARTGATRAEVSAPNGAWHWLAQDDDVLFGSCGAAGAPRRDQSRAEVVDQYRDRRPLVVSQTVFRAGGWQHRGGAIPTSTLAVAGGRLHFLESALAGDPGRARLGDLLSAGADLVALDVTSGEVLWRRPFEVREEVHVLYTIAAAGRLVSVGSYDHEDRIWYRVRVHDAATGEELWSATHANNRSGTGGDHGEQVHHPLLRGRTLIVEPLAYDLDTGHVVDPTGGQGWSIPARGGCGTISASSNALFFRDGHPTILDLVPGGGRRKLTEVTRPGCWINVLPAAGLVLVPEASSGCVCAYPVQTSMAFLPVAD